MSREIFAKMAGTLDSNRKIRKAGRDGRDVFLWVLRQVALRDSDGAVPTDDLTDFDYLADQLMCSPADAERGYLAACAVGLLVTDNARSVTRIVGWSGDWGRRPRSNAERQADYRARHGSAKSKKPVDDGDVTEAPLPVTADVTSNPVEESRVEESRERGAVTPAPTLPGFESKEAKPPPTEPKPKRKKPFTTLPADFAPSQSHVDFAREHRLDLSAEVAKFRFHHEAKRSEFAQWGAALSTWLHNARDYQARDTRGHAPVPSAPRRKFL